MSYKSKIKMSSGWIYPIGILVAHIFVVTELLVREFLIKGGYDLNRTPLITYSLTGLFFIIIGFYQWFKYRNWIYPLLGILLGLGTFQASFAIFGQSDIFKASYYANVVVILLFIILNWRSFYSHEKFELNSRRLFRLASERIYETSNGYTDRPYSAGRFECSRDELLGFIRFLHGNYIVRPFYYKDNVYLSFSMNRSLVVIHEASEVSHISIGYDGGVTVKVSEKDYSDYNERLSFDQLCESLAGIFARFLDYYKKGQESRIMIELKSAK